MQWKHNHELASYDVDKGDNFKAGQWTGRQAVPNRVSGNKSQRLFEGPSSSVFQILSYADSHAHRILKARDQKYVCQSTKNKCFHLWI